MPSSKSKPKYGTALQRHLDKKRGKSRHLRPPRRSSSISNGCIATGAIILLVIFGVVKLFDYLDISFFMFLVLLPAMIATYYSKR